MIDLYKFNVFPNEKYSAPIPSKPSISKANRPSSFRFTINAFPDMVEGEILRFFAGRALIYTYTLEDFDVMNQIQLTINEEKLVKIFNKNDLGELKLSYILDSRDVANNLSTPGILLITA